MSRSHPAESNPAAKLTWPDVREIRRARAQGEATNAALAERFGVCVDTVQRAAYGITWRTDPEATR